MNQKGFSTSIFICAIVILSLSIIGGAVLVRDYLRRPISKNVNPAPLSIQEKNPQDNESSTSVADLNNGTEIKYIGTINEFNNGCWSDGNCSVRVDDKWIITVHGGLRPPGVSEEPRGELIGLNHSKDTQNYVGKKVEVYAKILKDNSLTIYGNQDYYVKVLDK